ncbi:N-acetylneuraminate synthase [Tumebacillus sp. BK434]|uniref:N-acetylneuraminate synthase n=1 Tax=Tumebacillus sp. BK434 TaxID=2512169 RepID=UPI00104D15B5|nr:N-acetylneuraminate synthase [Tumebacillus sp. BK434]TCP57849.1 N-acetylneuraminate synthase [Tumebacillus sp. BK434]
MTRTYILAEAGVNHNGSLDLAKQLIDAAVEAGADAVKFQTFKTEKLVSKAAEKAEYQKETTGAQESQYEMIKKLELDEDAHRVLIEHCGRRGIQFLSTPFDMDSVDLLAGTFDLPRLKAPSGEITNAPLLLKMARTGKPIIVSTGMSTLGEVETALGVLAYGYLGGDEPSAEAFQAAYAAEAGQRMLQEKVTLLHCTTEYPTPYGDVNLRAMDAMGQAFGLPVGYSDHTQGIAVPIAAAARGAVLIEKHFTLDRTLPGPDHQASLEPDELKAMVDGIRQIEAALGVAVKVPVASELKNKPVARKSLVAARAIAKGELFTAENVTVKRPGTGKSPLYFWDVLGRTAERDYQEEDPI